MDPLWWVLSWRKPDKASHGASQPTDERVFRPGKVPDEIILGRYLGGSRVSRRSIDRADPDWVHGRGHDPRAAQLRQKTVLIIGCGSVGGWNSCPVGTGGDRPPCLGRSGYLEMAEHRQARSGWGSRRGRQKQLRLPNSCAWTSPISMSLDTGRMRIRCFANIVSRLSRRVS